MNDLEYHAHQYAAAGLAVLPLKPDKTPFTVHGVLDATKDEATISKWWAQWPAANIGIATGQASGGICVIDQDEKNGEHGIETFDKWIYDSMIYIDDTWESRTASGGRHTFFRSTIPVANRVGWLDGVDVRGDGGYIVAPPSVLADGSRYEWLTSPTDLEAPITNEDDPNVEQLISEINKKGSSGVPLVIPETIVTGGRNDMLYKMACSLQSNNWTDSAIWAAVKAENATKCNPPLPDDEVDKLIRSALSKPKGKTIEKAEAVANPQETKTAKLDFPLRTRLRSVKELMETTDDPLVVFVGDEKTPLLSEGTTVLAAPPKLGKSWFCLNLCQNLHDGTPFLGLPTKKVHVMYYDLEQSERLEKKRIKQMAKEMGIDYAEGFYIEEELQRVDHGLAEQLELDLKMDPEIGVFIIDVFANVEPPRRTTETEYQAVYRNFNVINKLAKQHHVSVILVMHTRKVRDKEHPFDNILGSSANQGAASHMIVLDKEKYNVPTIHLYAQGRETEGVIEMDYSNDGGVLKIVDVAPEAPDDLREFMESEVRQAVVRLMEVSSKWKGRCSELINECARNGIGMDADALEVGKFLSKNVGKLMKHDGIQVTTIKNGQGSNSYILSKQPLMTVDEEWNTVDEDVF